MYDFLVHSINQKKFLQIHCEKLIATPVNKPWKKTPKYYHTAWPFLNNTFGIMYRVYTEHGLGEFECCDEIFNIGYDTKKPEESEFDRLVPINYDECVPISVKNEYKDELVSLVKLLVNSSPINMVAILICGQSNDREIVQGVIDIDHFEKLISLNRLRTNVCYLIGRIFIESTEYFLDN